MFLCEPQSPKNNRKNNRNGGAEGNEEGWMSGRDVGRSAEAAVLAVSFLPQRQDCFERRPCLRCFQKSKQKTRLRGTSYSPKKNQKNSGKKYLRSGINQRLIIRCDPASGGRPATSPAGMVRATSKWPQKYDIPNILMERGVGWFVSESCNSSRKLCHYVGHLCGQVDPHGAVRRDVLQQDLAAQCAVLRLIQDLLPELGHPLQT